VRDGIEKGDHPPAHSGGGLGCGDSCPLLGSMGRVTGVGETDGKEGDSEMFRRKPIRYGGPAAMMGGAFLLVASAATVLIYFVFAEAAKETFFGRRPDLRRPRQRRPRLRRRTGGQGPLRRPRRRRRLRRLGQRPPRGRSGRRPDRVRAGGRLLRQCLLRRRVPLRRGRPGRLRGPGLREGEPLLASRREAPSAREVSDGRSGPDKDRHRRGNSPSQQRKKGDRPK
jgi:hypothetical protein